MQGLRAPRGTDLGVQHQTLESRNLWFKSQCLEQDAFTPYEPRHEKTGFLPRRKQRRRSASR